MFDLNYINSKKYALIALVFFQFLLNYSYSASTNLWIWKCTSNTGFCTRLRKSTQIKNRNDLTYYPSIEVCRLVCGKYGALWPRPINTTILSKELLQFQSSSISFNINASKDAYSYLKQLTDYFLNAIFKEFVEHDCLQTSNKIAINFNVASDDTTLHLDTDESYELNLTTNNDNNTTIAEINSSNVFGARHAIESILQLISLYENNDGSNCLVTVKEAKIKDKPFYKHRGLLIDSARNFLTIPVIKRNLDAMAASKLNVLHWHITDSQSFPLELTSLPNMTIFGAYDRTKIYYPSDITDLIDYAKLRGIRILIEIDAPSHAGFGWQWGPEAGLGNLSVCINKQPHRSYCIQPPCGQLNPINPNLYKVLNKLYSDIVDMTQSKEVFHMGGDEVYIPCWNTTQEIIDYFQDNPRTEQAFLDLWSMYQSKALDEYDKVVGDKKSTIILWSSGLTDVNVIANYLPKERYVIQTWVPSDNDLTNKLIKLGYRVIVSTKDKWYLDHGFWGSTTYHNWRNVYSNQLPHNQEAVLGGEVCMWGEYVDDSLAESRIWPRAAAAAERLWTNPFTGSAIAETRFYRHRERLVSRGINAEALTPKWCYQNEGECT